MVLDGFKGHYEYAPHVWNYAYPSPDVSPEWHGFYPPVHGLHEVQRSSHISTQSLLFRCKQNGR